MSISQSLPSFVRASGRLLLPGSFVYVCLVALVSQFWVLPPGLPQLYGGEGLLKFGDSVNFHEKAILLVAQIRESSWSAWRLSPGESGYTPASLATVLYNLGMPLTYALSVPNLGSTATDTASWPPGAPGARGAVVASLSSRSSECRGRFCGLKLNALRSDRRMLAPLI